MNCMEARALVEDALDKSLAGSRKRALDLHLSRCDDCRAFFDFERKEHRRWFQAMNEPEARRHLPEGFADDFIARMTADHAKPQRIWAFARMFRRIAAVLVAMLIFAGLSYAAVVAVGRGGLGVPDADSGDEPSAQDVTNASEATVSADAEAAPLSSAPSESSVPSVSSTTSTKGEATMNIRQKMATALAAAALAAAPAPAESLAYAAGDTALGGKIVITYDTTETSKIKTLVATPANGETLEISGAAMTFAAGATISMAADGKLIFANDVTADGALALDRTDGAYCDWTSSKSGAVNANNCLRASGDNIFEGKLISGWELVGVFAFADYPLLRPISKTEKGNHAAVTSSDKHGTWTSSNISGAYSIIAEDVVSETRKEYVVNRWTGEYTYSVRLWLLQDGDNINGRARTGVCGKQFGRYPDKNLWQESSDLWSGWYGNNGDHSNPNYFDSPTYLGINRIVIRKVGSDVATVGFSGEVSLNGQTDIALGVKLAVLPKEASTFTAPVFSGEGDVEYQRNATLANVNLMKYATGLSVTNAQVKITNKGAFPTNAVVDVWKNGIILANIGGLGAEQGISDGWFDITIRNGGEFRTQNGKNGGFNNAQLVEIDGGTLCFDYQDTSSTGSANRYVRYLTLLNGGVLTGKKVRVGYDSNQPYWHVTGTSPSTNDIRLIMHGYGAKWFRIDVDDIAEGVDFVCNKNVETLDNNNISDFIKEGAGTMEMNGKFELLGGKAICVYGGTLILGANSGFSGTSKNVELKNGGTLAKASGVQAFGTLDVLAGGGTLELGQDATMSFDDSSARSWAGTLTVKGFRDNAIRFGTSADGLSATQQMSIRTVEGRRLHLLSNGYLAPRGFSIVIR